MNRHSEERKRSALKKLLPPSNMSVAEVSKAEGISTGTLYNWRQNAKQSGEPVPGKKSTAEQWSAQAKLATVTATATMSESQLSQYCREKGLYVEQVKQWKQVCLKGFSSSEEQEKAFKQQVKSDQLEIKSLRRELRHKEKALAETAAILVMRKKLDAFWDNDDEGN